MSTLCHVISMTTTAQLVTIRNLNVNLTTKSYNLGYNIIGINFKLNVYKKIE